MDAYSADGEAASMERFWSDVGDRLQTLNKYLPSEDEQPDSEFVGLRAAAPGSLSDQSVEQQCSLVYDRPMEVDVSLQNRRKEYVDCVILLLIVLGLRPTAAAVIEVTPNYVYVRQ